MSGWPPSEAQIRAIFQPEDSPISQAGESPSADDGPRLTCDERMLRDLSLPRAVPEPDPAMVRAQANGDARDALLLARTRAPARLPAR
jgi:hypothetical protein